MGPAAIAIGRRGQSMAYASTGQGAEYYSSDDEVGISPGKAVDVETRKPWDADLERDSEKFLNERAPPIERTDKAWLEKGHLPKLGENDTTIKKSFETMKLDWLDKDYVPGGSTVGLFKWGHDDSVQCVEFSHCGNFIASGSCDGWVCIWSVDTTDCLSVLNHREKWVLDLKFCPTEDEQLVTAAADNAIRVWQIKNIKTGGITDDPYILRVMQEHNNWVNCITYLKQGAYLVSGSADKTILMWDVEKAEVLSVGRRHASWVNDVAVQNDGDVATTILACASADKRVSLWTVSETQQVQCIGTLLQHKDWVTKVIFTKDDENILLSASKDATVCMWNVEAQQLLACMSGAHEAPILSIVQSNVNRQGIRHCISASEDKTCMFWNVENRSVTKQGARKKRSVGHTGPVYDVATSPCGTFFVTGSEDTSVRLWNAITCVCLKKFEHREDTSWTDQV